MVKIIVMQIGLCNFRTGKWSLPPSLRLDVALVYQCTLVFNLSCDISLDKHKKRKHPLHRVFQVYQVYWGRFRVTVYHCFSDIYIGTGIQCTLNSISCTVYRVQCTNECRVTSAALVYNVHCTLYTVPCTVYKRV